MDYCQQHSLSLLQRDCNPAYFFLCAATALIERRRVVQQMKESTTQPGPQSVPDVVPGKAVGQLVTPSGRRLTDAEFLAWLQVCTAIRTLSGALSMHFACHHSCNNDNGYTFQHMC